MFKLGKKPARSDAVSLKFGAYFSAPNLPTVPKVFGRPWLVQNWQMLANDSVGDCVIAGAAHETMLLNADAGKTPVIFQNNDVLADYSAITGYVNGDPSTDTGTDVQTAFAYRQKTGVIDRGGERHKVDVYTALKVHDLSELALATFLFGAAGIGVQLPDTAESQFNYGQPWTFESGASIIGGHYIPCVGRNSQGNYLFVTWGRLQAATPTWVEAYMDEGVAFFSRERLKASGLSPQGYNESALEDDFKVVTS